MSEIRYDVTEVLTSYNMTYAQLGRALHVDRAQVKRCRLVYLAGDFPRSDLVNDLDTRNRWDIFCSAGGLRDIPHGRYLDSHIDTALRNIVPTLKETPQ